MSRMASAVLLVALGLGICLWLGFNPQGRALAQKDMERATLYFTEARTGVNAWFAGVQSNQSQAPRSSEPQQAENSRSSSELVALQNLWDATRQVWISLLSRFELRS